MPTVLTLDPYAEFFARIWSIDVACPGCGALYVEKASRMPWTSQRRARRGKSWDPLTSHFQCWMCRAHFVFGVVAWLPPFGSLRQPVPKDHVPKPWHQAQLRELLGAGGLMMSPTERLAVHQDANLIITRPCSCTVDAAGMAKRDPVCAVHGRRFTRETLRSHPKSIHRHPNPKPYPQRRDANGRYLKKGTEAPVVGTGTGETKP